MLTNIFCMNNVYNIIIKYISANMIPNLLICIVLFKYGWNYITVTKVSALLQHISHYVALIENKIFDTFLHAVLSI